LQKFETYRISFLPSFQDPITPVPCVKILNDKYQLYLDYEVIVQTTSAEEAISILLCLYNLFEIKFQRHSRGVHLLYGIMFEDQNDLTKSLRKVLLTWDYIIKNKPIVHQHRTTTTATNSNQNEEVNNVNEETISNHSFNQTQESGKP
jgi:hypothetical protein